jgi:hypothetical protein
MQFTTGTVFSTLVALAAAYTAPDYTKGPEGNAIRYPGLNEQVPEGAPYEIKWDNTLGETVSLVLLRGPSTNVVPLETIVEDIPNSGHYTWTPGYNLEVDTTHYGLLIVVEGTGAYQWSSQFGISKGKGSTTTAASSTTTTAAGSGSNGGTVTVIEDVTTTYCPESETAAPSSTPLTITTVIEGVTTTICPEEEASTTPVGVSPSSYSTQVESVVVTTTECPEESQTQVPVAPTTPAPVTPSGSRVPHVPTASSTLKSTPLAVAPTGTAAPTASATPVFNGAGRTSISLGAVMAGLFAVLAF